MYKLTNSLINNGPAQLSDTAIKSVNSQINGDNSMNQIENVKQATYDPKNNYAKPDAHKPYGEPNLKSEFNDSGNLDFYLPQYGVQNFINERALWEKGVHNITGEPGWFYFKIFFKFNTTYGLFGNLFDSNHEIYEGSGEAEEYIDNLYGQEQNKEKSKRQSRDQISSNFYSNSFVETFDKSTSALRYLFGIRNHYSYSLIYHRILALYKFAYLLSYINTKSPWFFSGISNINKLNATTRDEITKERYIDLICNGDAIDMRLDQLLEFYKYATYDNINYREILPDNLRKFDMSIVVMNAPIKYFQTGMFAAAQTSNMPQIGSNGSTVINQVLSGINKVSSFLSGNNIDYFDYKTINGKNNAAQDRLTFDMYTLKNCEIDPVSFEGYVPNSISNQQFFRMGTGAIKIKFDRCYKHTYNEWNQTMLGDDGFYFDGFLNNYKDKIPGDIYGKLSKEIYDNNASNNNNKRIEKIQKSIYNTFFNKDATAYKALIDFSESIIEDSLINASDPKFMGNIGKNYNENNIVDRFKNIGEQIGNYFKW